VRRGNGSFILLAGLLGVAAVAVVAIVALTAYAAVSGGVHTNIPASDNPFPDRQTLLAAPAASISLPGADELEQEGAERASTIEGYRSASIGGIYGTDLGSAAVHDYFDGVLRAQMGWVPDLIAGAKNSTDRQAWGWCRGTLNYRIAILDPLQFDTSLTGGRQFSTVFETTLIGREPSQICAAP
jgi:hypothetical protein